MDEVLKELDELEAAVEHSPGGFMGRRVIREEEFFTRVQRLRTKLNAMNMRSSRDVLAQALTLTRDERRKLAESLLRD